jgi:hypothetical protein
MVGENRLLEISHSRGFVRSTETSTASTMLNRRVGNVQMRFFFFFFFFFFESEFLFRGAYNGVQRRSRRLLRVMLGRFTSENRGQCKLATCNEIR